jgi:hypothetical protein
MKRLIGSGPMMLETEVKTSKCLSCEGWGRVVDPEHGQGQKCEPCRGSGVVVITVDEKGRFIRSPGSEEDKSLLEAACGVHQCQRRAMPNRKICENHAFPASRPPKTTGRRAAVLATRKKLAAEETKVSEAMAEKTKVSEDIADGPMRR